MPKKRKTRASSQKKSHKKIKPNPSVEEISPDVENIVVSNTTLEVEKISPDVENDVSNTTAEFEGKKDENPDLTAEDTADQSEEFIFAPFLESQNEEMPPLASNENIATKSSNTLNENNERELCNDAVNSNGNDNAEILNDEKKIKEVSVIVQSGVVRDTIEVIDVDELPDIPDSPVGDDVIEITASTDNGSKNKKKKSPSFVDLTKSEENALSQEESTSLTASVSSSRMDMLALLAFMDDENDESSILRGVSSDSLQKSRTSSFTQVTCTTAAERSRTVLPSFIYDFSDVLPGPSRNNEREIDTSLEQNKSIPILSTTQETSDFSSLSNITQPAIETSSFIDLLPINIQSNEQQEAKNSSSAAKKKSKSKLNLEKNPPDSPRKAITCPICMDDSTQIFANGLQLISTYCGHVFCSSCVKKAIETQGKCPTCRKKLTKKKIHPIFL